MHSHNGLAYRGFRGASGHTEHYISVEAPGDLSLPRQIDTVCQRYAGALQALRPFPNSGIFRRIYLSDAANQASLVRQGSLFTEPLDSPVAVSIMQQPPLPDCKIALMAYHTAGPSPTGKHALSREHLLARRGELDHLWPTPLCTGNNQYIDSAFDRTRNRPPASS